MRQAKLYRYTLPMDSGVILRDTKLTSREGWVVELIENGKHALGEIAPLPGFSQESLQEAGIQAQQYLESWVKEGHLDSDLDECFPFSGIWLIVRGNGSGYSLTDQWQLSGGAVMFG